MNNILLLEDLPEIRAWLKSLVMQVFPGARITECSRVQDALLQVQSVRFDLALCDLGLPDGSGTDVVAKLRDVQPEAQSVVVTIHDDDEHLFPALQAGAFGYLLKEQSREQLAERAARLWAALADGTLPPPVIERHALDAAAEAHARLESRRTTGPLILVA